MEEGEGDSIGKQSQFVQLMRLIEGDPSPPRKRCVVEDKVEMAELEDRVDIDPSPKMEEIKDMAKAQDDSLFMQRTRRNTMLQGFPAISAPASCAIPHTVSAPRSMLKRARDFLFLPPFKIGRVFTNSGSSSGTGWISTPPYVVTCAHVVNQAQGEQLYMQFPDDTTIAKLHIVFVRPPHEYAAKYERDVAFLEIKGAGILSTLSIAGIKPGEVNWAAKCVSAGMLAPYSPSVSTETQKMLNPGSVESCSRTLTTTNARADKGFSGGPILNSDMKIIGMIQGGHGDDIKSVKIIPIDEISNVSCIISQLTHVPPIAIPMAP